MATKGQAITYRMLTRVADGEHGGELVPVLHLLNSLEVSERKLGHWRATYDLCE